MDYTKEQIRIGTLIKGNARTADYLQGIWRHGFESFQIAFGGGIPEDVGLQRLADEIRPILEESGAVISSLGVYGNSLAENEAGERIRRDWERLIDNAGLFGVDVIAGFAGRVTGKPVPDSIGRFEEVFTPLAERAAGKGLRIAFENCPMGGNWETGDHNIAFNPDAWELMFDAVPAENLGLEWEPCHQMCQLIDPLPQLREWVGRVFHVHGKDASVHHDAVARRGIHSKDWFAFHRHPGFGDSNWTDIVSELRHGGFSGSIDIEGWHDRVYSGALEMTGQVRALHYLRDCRASFVPNPEAM